MALQEELKHQGDYLFKFRSYLPLLLLILALGVKYYRLLYVVEGRIAELLGLSAFTIGILGLGIRIFTVGYTPANTSGRNTTGGQVADELNTTGIYSLMRNPLYLGNYLMWLAIAMLTGSLSFVVIFTLVFWIYYERIVYAEESFLRQKFEDPYLKWAAKTPVFLPSHFHYQKPNIGFSWKKVAKKEKNGLLALFLLFWLFEILENYVQSGTFTWSYSWVFIGTIASGVLYLIFKILKKYTHFLDEEGR